MNKLELRILAERLFEAVTKKQATISPEDEKALRRVEEILEEEVSNGNV